jgi:hypothetical protein
LEKYRFTAAAGTVTCGFPVGSGPASMSTIASDGFLACRRDAMSVPASPPPTMITSAIVLSFGTPSERDEERRGIGIMRLRGLLHAQRLVFEKHGSPGGI